MKRHSNRLFGPLALLATFVLAFLAGCSANYGRLEINSAVEQSFRNYDMLDQYQYYYSGRENKPSAIIGIDPTFQFSSEFWKAIEPLAVQNNGRAHETGGLRVSLRRLHDGPRRQKSGCVVLLGEQLYRKIRG